MSRLLVADRLLSAAALAWLGFLLLVPTCHGRSAAFGVSAALIGANAACSFWSLTQRRRIPIVLNCVQIALFGVLSYQLYSTFGTSHFCCSREPQFYDWVEFTFAHVLRAADFFDALDEYGIPVQTITHNSTAAALIVVGMHLTVDGFLLGLAVHNRRRCWQTTVRETSLERGRREFAWLLVALVVFVGFAAAQQLPTRDWLLWPLDNLLRLVDVGDVMQLFGWRLHGVDANGWTKAAGVLFRLAAGIGMARLVILWRLTVFRTWGLCIEELTALLDDPDAQMRLGAATGLGLSGPEAREATAALIERLHDFEPTVRCAAAWALGRIGPDARDAVDPLIDAVWLGQPSLSVAAAEALGGIGPEARSAIEALAWLRKVSDQATCRVIEHALEKIAPTWTPEPAVKEPPPPSKRLAAWQRSIDAACVRQQQNSAIRAILLLLLDDGFFAQARDPESLRPALEAKGLGVDAADLAMPLFLLTTEGRLTRRKSDLGRWVYRSRCAV